VSYKDGVIFQRTDSGNAEIRKSNLLLRHNERMVLVLIDGVNTYAEARCKLRSLVRDKFDRALDGLKEKGLITEILFPLIDKQRDAISPEVLVDFLKINSKITPDTKIDLSDDVFGSQQAGAPALGMISGNSRLSIDTRAGVPSQMRPSENNKTDSADIDLPLDLSLDGVVTKSRPKTKLVNVYPTPEQKKRKRSKRPVVVQIGWHIYVYYGLLALGILLVLYAVLVS
jgi:hypothetical protein